MSADKYSKKWHRVLNHVVISFTFFRGLLQLERANWKLVKVELTVCLDSGTVRG